MQTTLFDDKETIKEKKEVGKMYFDKQNKSEEYCLNVLKTENYLWDMRCWDKYKDEKEVYEWIKKDFQPNNCGHAVWCARLLLKGHKTDIKKVVQAIMENPHKKYKNRIVKCFDNPNRCPKFKKQGHYGGICDRCK